MGRDKVEMWSRTVRYWFLTLSIVGVGKFLPGKASHEVTNYDLYSSLPEKFLTTNSFHDVADRCSWLNACICRNESLYTNGSYKLLVNCTQSGLQNIPLHIPGTTTVLTLDGNSLKKIKPGAFKNLNLLKYLDLSDNAIETLNEDIFEGLTNLHTLEISGNKIRYDPASLPDVVFNQLSKLVRLNLHQKLDNFGKDEKYPTKALSELKQLEHLLIDGLQPENNNSTFPFLATMRTLELGSDYGRCNIKTLTVNTFKTLRSITDITIRNCSLDSVERGSFSELKNLTNLDMSHNVKLQFRNLANITYGLKTNAIRALKLIKIHETFGDCVRLEKEHLLNLKDMKIDDVYLDENRLSYVSEDAVRYIPRSIRKLSLTNNMLLAGDYLHEIFASSVFAKLKYLTLAEQNMNYDALKFFNNKTRQMMTSLQRKHYDVKSVYPAPRERPNERYKNGKEMASNSINSSVKISPFCSNCFTQGLSYDIILYFPAEIKDLDFSGLRIRNELKNICICEPNSLLRINLERNIFWNWQGPISGVSNLLRLNLAWNSCDNLSVDVFDEMTSLIELNLTRNFIERFLREDTEGRIFQNMKGLWYLLLADNKIRYIPPKLFQGLESLKGLDLSYNFLTQIDIEFSPKCTVQYLDLSNNLLNKIGPKITRKFDDETKSKKVYENYYLDLSNNKLSCKCNDTDFIAWVSRTDVNFINFKDYLCNYVNGQQWKLTDASTIYRQLLMDCADYTMIIVASCLGFVLFLITIVGGVVYRYRWDLRYFYYSFKLKMKGKPIINREGGEAFKYDAFVSYASGNGMFVKDEIVPELEDKRNLQLLVHDRDFRAGEFVNDNIMQAITASRKTLILMSKDFLKSDWCIFEMNMARMEGIKTGRNVVCLLMLEEVPSAGLPLEIMDIIRQQTYIELPADINHMDLFWDRVHNALIN